MYFWPHAWAGLKTRLYARVASAFSSGSRRAPAALWAVCLVAVLALTNTWPDFVYGVEVLGQVDTASYRAIAVAAPDLPGGPVDYQHAQRFWLPWVLGSTAKISGLPLDALYRSTAIVLVFACGWAFTGLLRRLQLPLEWQAVLLAAAMLNPYGSRYYLAVPYMSGDLVFALGFAIVVTGVAQFTPGVAAVGVLLSSFGRQTALALNAALWVWLAWQWIARRTRAADVLTLVVASVAVAVVYWAAGVFAGATGAVSDNVEHLTGLASWLIDGWPRAAADLPIFLLLGVFSQSASLALIGALGAATRLAPRSTVWFVALLVVAVWTQPVLAGPDITGRNIARLWSVASVGLPAMAALLVAHGEVRLPAPAAWAAGLLMFAGSMHHQWSWPGQLLIQTPARFGILHATASGLAGVLVYVGAARARAGAASPSPAR